MPPASFTSDIPAQPEQADTLFLLNIFGGMIYPQRTVETIIGRELLMGSSLYREAEELGRLSARREDILAILGVRFGAETTEHFREAVDALEDVNQLAELHLLAARCADAEEFGQALAASAAARPRRRRR